MVSGAASALVVAAALFSLAFLVFIMLSYFIIPITSSMKELAEYSNYVASASIKILNATLVDSSSITVNVSNSGSVPITVDEHLVVIVSYTSNGSQTLAIGYPGHNVRVEAVYTGGTVKLSPQLPLVLYPGSILELIVDLPAPPDAGSLLKITIATSMGVRASYVFKV